MRTSRQRMSNQISISPEQVIDASGIKDEYSVKEWNGLHIVVRRLINVEDMFKLIDNIMSTCVTKDGVFVPEMIDFVTRSNIVLAYSNVLLPNGVNEQYKFLYETGIYECVVEEINKGQYGSIIKAVDILANK